MIITIQNRLYTFEKDPYESNDIFYNRIWFIVSQEPKNQIELNKYIDYSYIWINITFKHLTYDKIIMDNIKTYSDNLHKQFLYQSI